MPTLNFPDEILYQKLKDLAANEKITITDLVRDIVFDCIFRKGEREHFNNYYISKEDYEKQAKELVEKTLMEYERERVFDAAKGNGVTVWQQLMSYVRYCLNNGFSFVLEYNPEWSVIKKQDVKNTFICLNCGLEKPLSRPGELFCSNQCAKEYEIKKVSEDGNTYYSTTDIT